jgi:hypothetical protein
LIAGVLVLGLALGGLGIANAAVRTRVAQHSIAPTGATASPIATLSDLSGLPIPEIMTLRAQGESLAEIATENGVDPDVVVAQALSQRESTLDALVQAGRLTASREQAILDNMKRGLEAMLNVVPRSGAATAAATSGPQPEPTTNRETIRSRDGSCTQSGDAATTRTTTRTRTRSGDATGQTNQWGAPATVGNPGGCGR